MNKEHLQRADSQQTMRTLRPYLGRMTTLFSVILTIVLTAFLPVQAVAQESQSGTNTGGLVEIKVIGDKILARVELQTQVWFKDTHIVIDYDSPHAMMFNRGVLRGLRFGEGETTIRALNEGFRLEIPRDGIIQEIGTTTQDLTARYDNELEQIDIVAIVGWPALRSFGLTLDIQEGTMQLHPDGELSPAEVEASVEKFVQGVELIGDSVYIPVNYNGGQRGFMKMATGGYHTVLNRELLDDREAGVVDEAYLGDDQIMMVSDMAALYPQDLYQNWYDQFQADKEQETALQAQADALGVELPPHLIAQAPDHPSSDVLLVSGLSILSGYRIVLDPNQQFAGFSRTLNSNYSEADHQFYMAAAAKSEDKLFQFLEENPEDRNVEEAVSDVFALGLESGATVDRQSSAIQFGLDITDEQRQFMYVAQFVFGLVQSDESREQHSELIIALGEKALPFVGRSESPRFRQQVQMLVGDRYLARNDAENAWKYFLSAAFNGDPEMDAFVRYDLGRVYEALGRNRRAYANYDRAISTGLPPSLNETAQTALERLKLRLDPDDELLQEDSEDG